MIQIVSETQKRAVSCKNNLHESVSLQIGQVPLNGSISATAGNIGNPCFQIKIQFYLFYWTNKALMFGITGRGGFALSNESKMKVFTFT